MQERQKCRTCRRAVPSLRRLMQRCPILVARGKSLRRLRAGAAHCARKAKERCANSTSAAPQARAVALQDGRGDARGATGAVSSTDAVDSTSDEPARAAALTSSSCYVCEKIWLMEADVYDGPVRAFKSRAGTQPTTDYWRAPPPRETFHSCLKPKKWLTVITKSIRSIAFTPPSARPRPPQRRRSIWRAPTARRALRRRR